MNLSCPRCDGVIHIHSVKQVGESPVILLWCEECDAFEGDNTEPGVELRFDDHSGTLGIILERIR